LEKGKLLKEKSVGKLTSLLGAFHRRMNQVKNMNKQGIVKSISNCRKGEMNQSQTVNKNSAETLFPGY